MAAMYVLVAACSADEATTGTEGNAGGTAGTAAGGTGDANVGTGGSNTGGYVAGLGGTTANLDARAAVDADQVSDAAKPDAPTLRSAGCGKPNPPSGNLTIDVQGKTGKYVLSLPGNYQPTTAYPVGFAFHGRERTGPQCQQGDCLGFQSVMKEHAILVYMTSLNGDGWEHVGAPNDEREINVAFWAALRDRINNTYCVNDQRVFVAGSSSGASFTNILACRFGDKLLAAAPVAGGASTQNCKGQVAALVIHGYKDPHVPFPLGEEQRNFHIMQNHCLNKATPSAIMVHDSVLATPESHKCAMFEGCDSGFPVVWCEHSEGGYDGSTHGWPKFGGQKIWDFVQGS